jgi:hypothetical protein
LPDKIDYALHVMILERLDGLAAEVGAIKAQTEPLPFSDLAADKASSLTDKGDSSPATTAPKPAKSVVKRRKPAKPAKPAKRKGAK